MMVASGASGASSSGVNQAPLLPALQPQPPAAELDGGGAANNNVGVGVVPPAESSASNNSNQPILDAPPLQEGDQESHHHGQHPDPREQLLSSSEALNKRLRDLFSQTGNPLKDSSAIFDITDAILGGSTDPNRISEVLNNLHEFGTQSQWNVGKRNRRGIQERATEKRDENSRLEMLEGAKSMGAGAATIASAGAAVGIGNVLSSSIHSVARNPSLAKQSFGYAILGFALTEAIASFAPMMASLISSVFRENKEGRIQW
ncbi:Atp9 mitochondrion [Cinnamomum micranthum f. kanehirae]|uniref:ATP synthase subunit 9, mitochondrial n=6 Tax=Magnoliopsida TaxID=3398 RepID=A0A3S3PU62_9MAGN|nr:Atp9 mitochondrion [Cinnamomum micranthum f. kanehirae]